MLSLIGVGACLFTFVFARAIRNQVDRISARMPISSTTRARTAEVPRKFLPGKYERMVYPYSVIPGGVRSRGELAESLSEDRVAAAHFANFNISEARIVRTEETSLVHVSYRLRNKVFWTAKPVKIPKGEALITDGKETARTRCGNRVSATPQEPVSGEEPAIETFEIPSLAKLGPPESDTSVEPGPKMRESNEVPMVAKLEVPELGTSVETSLDPREFIPVDYVPAQGPIALPYYDSLPFGAWPPGAVVPEVPEPSTMSLLIVGLAAFAVFRFTKRG